MRRAIPIGKRYQGHTRKHGGKYYEIKSKIDRSMSIARWMALKTKSVNYLICDTTDNNRQQTAPQICDQNTEIG